MGASGLAITSEQDPGAAATGPGAGTEVAVATISSIAITVGPTATTPIGSQECRQVTLLGPLVSFPGQTVLLLRLQVRREPISSANSTRVRELSILPTWLPEKPGPGVVLFSLPS